MSVPCKYAKEAALVAHYDSHPDYYSPAPGVVPKLCEMLEFELTGRRRALDVGCGDGRLSLWLAQQYGMRVTGVDYSRVRIQSALNHAARQNLACEFLCSDLHAFLDESPGQFDLVALFEVLEHLENPESVVSRCRGLLGPDGVVLGSLPINMPYEAHLQVFETIDDVIRRFHPHRIARDERHWYCVWRKEEGPSHC